MDATIQETWAELNALQAETKTLLSSVRGTKKLKGNKKLKSETPQKPLQNGGETPIKVGASKKDRQDRAFSPIKKIKSASTSKKNKKQSNDTTLSLDSGMNLMNSFKQQMNNFGESKSSSSLQNESGPNISTRLTLEIYDNASPDTSPRLEEPLSETQKIQMNYGNKEKSFKEVEFHSEVNRVQVRDDVYVPAPGIQSAIENVKAERKRLALLEQNARNKLNEYNLDVDRRKNFLKADTAAASIQSLFRGKIGRTKYNLTKKISDFETEYNNNNTLSSTLDSTSSSVNGTTTISEWIEVRDRETGEMWYYNKISGVSQWEQPLEMKGSLAGPDRDHQRKLPAITPLKKTKGLDKKYNNSSNSIYSDDTHVLPVIVDQGDASKIVEDMDDPVLAHRRQEEEERAAEMEIHQELGLDGITPFDSLFSPDGHFKPKLRNTVRDALVQSRFDNVASVLQDEQWIDSQQGPFEGPPQPGLGVSKKQDLSRSSMTAPFKLDSSQKQKKKLSLKSLPSNNKQLTAKDLTLVQVAHEGFSATEHADSAATASVSNHQDLCFGCWSCGGAKKCQLHEDDTPVAKSKTMILCRNWDLSIMRRRYRSEEIQEIFMSRAKSLKYDNKRKKFESVTEARHQVYRNLEKYVNIFNARSVIVKKTQRWMRSLVDEVRGGRVTGAKSTRKTNEACRIMRLRRTRVQNLIVYRYSNEVRPFLPIGPTTGYSHLERIGVEKYLFTKFDPATKEDVELIFCPPVPVPINLYVPRKRSLPVSRQIPMPRPDYSRDTVRDTKQPKVFINDESMAGWLEECSALVTRTSMHNALENVINLTPASDLHLIRKTKAPPPSSIKLASVGRKPVPSMLDKRGLPIELLSMEIISTYIPPQYGGFMVMDKAAISAGISPEDTITFDSIPLKPILQVYVHRPLEHHLPHRRAPTAGVSSHLSELDKYLYGRNHPDQTGEMEPHGFRTSTWSRYLHTNMVTTAKPFEPDESVAQLNAPGANTPNTTHADLSYPFCEPASRDNTTLDFYFLLLASSMSHSLAQVFTALTVQEPGKFMSGGDIHGELGHLIVSVYRSWAFKQKDTIEHFKTDDGVDYWYHRRTGQTFWEYPATEEEKVTPLEGGTLVDREHKEEPMTTSAGSEGQTRRYDQGEFREILLKKPFESTTDAKKRRATAMAAAVVEGQKRQMKQDFADAKRQQAGEFDNDDDSTVMSGSQTATNTVNADEVRAEIARGKRPPTPAASSDEGLSSLGDANMTHISSETNLRNDHGRRMDLRAPGDMSQTELDASQATLKQLSDIDNSNSLMSEIDANSETLLAASAVNPLLAQLNDSRITDITKQMGTMLSNLSLEHAQTEDIIQLGLGMGMAVMNSGLMDEHDIKHKVKEQEAIKLEIAERNKAPGQGSADWPVLAEQDYDANGHVNPNMILDRAKPLNQQQHNQHGSHPIEAPSADGVLNSHHHLDHTEEASNAHRNDYLVTKKLTATEDMLGTEVVPTVTRPPDEREEKVLFERKPSNSDDAVRKEVPLAVYPHLSTIVPGGAPPETVLHGAAGKGTDWVGEEHGLQGDQVEDAPKGVRHTVMPLPVGFFAAIEARRVCTQEVDYLPQVPNLPQTRNVGRVKPRCVAMDWLAIGFDPWSAGKSPLNAEFIENLSSKAEKIFPDMRKIDAINKVEQMQEEVSRDVFVNVEDTAGLAAQRAEVNKAELLAADYANICSLARHNKFEDVEQLLISPDWNVPIDYQDESGNTLLHIACQNGSKKLAKLCVKRGCNLNIMNLNGQTALHFAFGYGYISVGEWLKSKGADDSILNVDGLTPYEGLGARELSML